MPSELETLLEIASQAAAAAGLLEGHVNLDLLIHIADKRGMGELAPLSALMDSIARDPDLAELGRKQMVLPGMSSAVQTGQIGGWLLTRAQSVGAIAAVDDVKRLLTVRSLDVRACVAFDGPEILATYQLAPDINVTPWSTFSDDRARRFLEDRELHGMLSPTPTGVLIQEASVPMALVPDDKLVTLPPPHDYSSLYDALLALGIATRSGPNAIASWLSLPDWALSPGTPYQLGYSPSLSAYRLGPLGNEQAALAQSLNAALQAHNSRTQARIRLAAHRLRTSIRRPDPVDAAIDLGVALEVLFLDPGIQNELTFRLRVRGARYLRSSTAERIALDRQLNELYGIRSRAVHTGELPGSHGGREVGAIIAEGHEIAAQALEKLILTGWPDWSQVLFA